MPKLHDLKNQRSQLVKEIRALATKEEDLPAGEQLPDTDIARMTQIRAEVDVLDASIDRLGAIVAMEMGEATPVDPDDALPEGERAQRSMMLRTFTGHGSGERQAPAERGFKAARFMIGLWHAKHGNMDNAANFIQRRFDDKEVAATLKALNTSGTATGGALIPQNFIPDLIELLRASTVVRGSNPMIIPMPMGNATVPRLAAGATAGYQGELDDIAVSQETFDDLQLNAKKLTAMVPVSNDLIRRAPIGVEAIVRDDLIQTLARREDLAFLLGDGSGNSPIGLLNLASAANKMVAAPFSGTDNATIVGQVSGVLQGLLLILEQNFARMIRPAWLFPPVVKAFLLTLRDGVGNYVFKDEINAGTLIGIPYKTTAQLPTNINTAAAGATAVNNGAYMYLVDFADVIIGETYNVLVDASDVASYKDAGGNVVSGFQRDQTVFRVISEHDFNIRHQASVAVVTVPGWSPTGYAPYGGAAFFVQAPSGDGSAAPSTFGIPPTGSNNPANSAANAPGGTQPGRP